jgi:hypothetical protein
LETIDFREEVYLAVSDSLSIYYGETEERARAADSSESLVKNFETRVFIMLLWSQFSQFVERDAILASERN